MGNIIFAIILTIAAIVCFVFSYRQYNETGYLLNNVYIYASKQEREKMDKKPYFRQSGIILLLVGVIFLILAADMILKTDWLIFCSIAVAASTIIYAVISSAKIDKKKK